MQGIFDNNETRGYLCEEKRSGYSLVNRVPRLAGIILIFGLTEKFRPGLQG